MGYLQYHFQSQEMVLDLLLSMSNFGLSEKELISWSYIFKGVESFYTFKGIEKTIIVCLKF